MLTFPSHTVHRTTRVYPVRESTTRVYFSLNSEKFRNFHYQAEIGIFEWKSQKYDNQGEFSDFYEFNLYMTLTYRYISYFLEIGHFDHGYFREKKNQNHI